jgi:uncharacterized membrane protein
MPLWLNRRSILDGLVVLISLGYPFLVYFGLMRFSPLTVGIALFVFLAIRVLINHHRQKRRNELGLFVLLLGVMSVLFLVDQLLAIKAYPVIISLSLAALFSYSLINPPPIIEKLARLKEPDLDEHGINYTRKVTIAWVLFFLMNASISSWTALYSNMEIWTLYNGLISYVLIGLMFGGEFVIRQIVRQKR